MRLFGREVRFGDRERADIVIFDETNSAVVKRALNPRYSVAVFEVRPEELRLGYRIVGNFLRFLGHLDLGEASRHRRGPVVGIAKQLICIYYESCIAAMNPKAVVTFIDNSDRFGWLSRNCRLFPFIAIQNGTRLGYAATPDGGYYLQHFFSWGRREEIEFSTFGYAVERYHPVGSVLASLHWKHGENPPVMYDLLVISTWRGNIGFPQDAADMMRSMEIMDRSLVRYIRSRKIRAAVLLRAERDREHWRMPEMGRTEEEYYQSIYGDSIQIIDADFVCRNIYPLMQESAIVVSCLSSALLEAFGFGKRTLYCNFTGTDLYHLGLDPAIVECNVGDLPDRLGALFDESESDYASRHDALRKYYMAYPDGEPTHLAIAEGIDRIISQHRAASV